MLSSPKLQIVIMAAGKGTRMQDDSRPKVLKMLDGLTMVEQLLLRVEALSLNLKPLVIVGYKKEMVMELLGDKVEYAFQEEQLGTGHAIQSAASSITAENVLVLSGDVPLISPDSLRSIMEAHFKSNQVITPVIGRIPNFENEFSAFYSLGRIIRKPDKTLEKIVELKDATPSQQQITEFNSGVYMFNSAWLQANLFQINNQNAQGEFYLTDLLAKAIDQGHNIMPVVVNPWELIGINSKAELEIAQSLQGKLAYN